MPIKACSIEGKDGFKWGDAGKCYQHTGSEASKKASRKKAMAQGVAIGDIKMSVMFDTTIPASFIKDFIKDGSKVSIYGGGGLFTKTNGAYKLAREAGSNNHNIYFGEIKHIVSNNDIDMFITTDEKYVGIDGFARYIPSSIDLSSKIDLAVVMEERWITVPSATKTGESCPICITLENMGWVQKYQLISYTWDSGSKLIVGLPPYRMAHSQIGDGLWKVDDNKCKCYKEYRSAIRPDNVTTLEKQEPLEVYFNICNHDHEDRV